MLHTLNFPFFNWRKVTPRSLRVPLLSSVVDTFFPQGLDDPNIDWLGLASLGSLYVILALIEDRNAVRVATKTDLEPHSSEGQSDTRQVEIGLNESSSQNVTFVDTHPGYTLSEKSTYDPLRDHPLEDDATLQEFFSRPILIDTQTWTSAAAPGGLLSASFNPWSLYFEDKRVVNRISNYRLLRSKLHLKFTISGNGFFYGRILCDYHPLNALDDLTTVRDYTDADFVTATQRPHVMLDPTNSQGAEMVLPFFWYKNLLDITTDEWDQMGTIHMESLVPLKHALGSFGEDITINTFAWAEDVKFAVPTSQEPGSLTPQSDEYGKGPISKVAATVANVASSLSSIPILRPFARSTEIGASAVGALATLFGYSRPIMLQSQQHRPNTKANLAVTNIEDDAVKLTVDAKQELTLDPRTAGLDGIDELGINYIAGRESFLTQFQWSVGTPGETILWNAIVDPGLFRVNSSEYHLPACAYACLPFKYWRGSMRYRFQVVCSKFHKGRLKIVYDPVGTVATAEYNTAYTTVIDIGDTTDFTIDVGWGQPTTYRPSLPIASVVESVTMNTTTLTYNSSTATFGNGTIAAYIVNELTAPDSTIDNDIVINVFVSAGEDFEVAVPDDSRLKRLRTTNSSVLVEPQSLEYPSVEKLKRDVIECMKRCNYPDCQGNTRACGYFVLRNMEPHSDENKGDETERFDSKPGGTDVTSSRGAHIPVSDHTNKVHFGESIRSFRQLVKRYNYYDNVDLIRGESNGTRMVVTLVRDSLPGQVGYNSTSGDETETLTAAEYKFGNMTLLQYLACAFGGWRGSTRWMYDFSPASVRGSTWQHVEGTLTAGVNRGDKYKTNDHDTLAYSTTATRAAYLEDVRDIQGHDGASVQSTAVNPTISFEVPYYSEYRFTPGKIRTVWDARQLAMPEYILKAHATSTFMPAHSWCAAGEDWTCFMYLGPPVFYYEGTIPTS